MNSIKHLFLMLFLVIGVVNADDNQIEISPEQLNSLGVQLGHPEAIEYIPLLYAPAHVVIPPAQEYILSAAQAGLISKLNVAVGDEVTKGDILAQINSPDLLALQRQYLKAKSEQNLAWSGYQRDKKLHQEGVISSRRWQETSSRYRTLVAAANEANQLLEIAGMSTDSIEQLTQTRKLSSSLNVTAPINGVVLERMVVAGERVDMLAPLYRIANLDQLWLEVNIPQQRLAHIKVGDLVQIENTSVTAKISLLGQSVNPVNQTVLARAIIDGKQTAARAGQSVNIKVIQHSEQAVYKVPNSAVAQKEGASYIFKRTQSGFQVIPVNVIGKEGRVSIISGQIKADEEIAVSGAVALKAHWMGLGSEE